MTIPGRVSDDAEHMAAAAKEALTRPRDFMSYDDRWYMTHGCVMEWADRDDDIMAESNYHVALDRLNGAIAHDETGASEARGDDVEDTGMGHWAVGSLRQIMVRVYTDDTCTEYTPAFREAVEIAWQLRYESPILDESDHSEREHNAFVATVDDALDSAARDYGDDSEAERAAFTFLSTWGEDTRERIYDAGYPDPDWERVADVYRDVRREHFKWLAQRMMTGYVVPDSRAPLPGQEPLPEV